MQRILRVPLLVCAVCVPAAFLLVGCSREPSAAPSGEKATRERSKFFTQVRAEPKSGGLKGRVEAKFPTLKIEVGGIGGPVTMNLPDGGPRVVRLELPLVVTDAPPQYAEIRPLILTELESYFRELITASGMEVDGPTREHLKEGRKDGFTLGHKSSAHSGTVFVGSKGALRGGILITVDEHE